MAEEMWAFKFLALLHEVGHAHDYDQQINYMHHGHTIDPVRMEVYAHRYVCSTLLDRNLRLLLKFYMTYLEKDSKGNSSELVKSAAGLVVRSTDFARYKEALVGLP